jgi:hypothetical protein
MDVIDISFIGRRFSWWERNKMKFKIALTISLLSLFSACSSFKVYRQSTGFSAPFEYSVQNPVMFCSLNLSLSDAFYLEEDKNVVVPVLRSQVIRYINADGRLQIRDENCSDNALSIDFVNLTDTWETENKSTIYSAKSQVDVSYKGREFSFLMEEVSKAENKYCARCEGMDYANSARNRGLLIDKVISAVVTRVEESNK